MVKETALYDLIGVKPDSTPQEIRSAYRKTALRLHPDRGGDTAQFQRLQEAYATVYDAEKRRIYDEYGEEGLKEGILPESRGPSISAEDIIAFAKVYRFSDMEREDVEALYGRPHLAKVLQCIPYSDRRDLKRFVEIFDRCDANAPPGEARELYAKVRVQLLKRAAKVKPREVDDNDIEEKGVEEPSDAEDIAPEGNTKKRKRVKSARKKSSDMTSLAKAFSQRAAQRKQEFGSFIDGLEQRALAEEQNRRDARIGKRRANKGAASSSGATSRSTRSGRVSKSTKKE